MSALRSCFAAQGLELVGFERYLRLRGKGGNHCHINLIGIPKAAASRALPVFQQYAQKAGLDFQETKGQFHAVMWAVSIWSL